MAPAPALALSPMPHFPAASIENADGSNTSIGRAKFLRAEWFIRAASKCAEPAVKSEVGESQERVAGYEGNLPEFDVALAVSLTARMPSDSPELRGFRHGCRAASAHSGI